MMRSMISFSIVLMAVGCGGSEMPYTDSSRDASAYARDIKQLVISSATTARRSKEPADDLLGVVSELENNSKRPLGDHAATYTELLGIAKRIHVACEQANGRPPGLEKDLDELIVAAEKLPGEVKIAAPND